MATITASATGGNWNTNAAWVGSVQPTAADDVVLISTSGAITIPTAVTALCRSIDLTGYTSTFTMSGTAVLTVGNASGGALKFVAGATVTLASTSTINFVSTSTNGGAGWAIGPASKTFGIVNFNGAGGQWVLNSQFTTAGAVTLTAGTVDLATNNPNCSWLSFASSNANVRALNLSSQTITITGGGTAWDTTTVTNLSKPTNTATVKFTAGGATATFGSTNWNGLSLLFNGGGNISINSSFTVANLTVTGTAAKTGTVSFNATPTITTSLTLNGNSATNRILLQSSTLGTARTLTAASVTASNVDLQDITGAGAAGWDLSAITGGSGDCGGNTNITFTPSATQYRVGATSTQSLWSDLTKWASTSGGSGSTGRVPLPQDDVVIDNNSTASNVNVAVDMPRAGHTIDSTAYTVAGSFGSLLNSTGGVATSIFGSWLQTRVFNANPTVALTLAGRSSYTLGLPNSSSAGLTMGAPGGTYTLTSNITTSSNLSIGDGTFNDGGFQVSCSTCTSSSGRSRAIIRSGNWLLTSTGATTLWSVTAAGLTLTDTGTMTISNASANTRTIAGFGLSYGILNYTVAGSTGTLVITGANTFTGINFSDASNARTLQFTAATTTTIASAAGWNVFGTAGALMSVQSATAATHTISIASGTVSSDYLSLTNSIATGGATFYAGANSTDVSGNSGWVFTSPPIAQDSLFGNLLLVGVG